MHALQLFIIWIISQRLVSGQDVIPIMQMRKPSLKGQKQVAQGHQPVGSVART